MEDLKRKLLNLIQDEFPIQPEPYKALADELNVSEKDVLIALEEMKTEGIIRRLGAIFDSRKIGYYSTLCAMRVPENRIDEVALIVNAFSGVTHNYLREHEYNIWFTLIAASEEQAQTILKQISNETGIQVKNLPAEKFFKVKVKFSFDRWEEGVLNE